MYLYLCLIINCLLACGVVPSQFKIAKVVPIFKNGHQDDLPNYQPVSMLYSLSKK